MKKTFSHIELHQGERIPKYWGIAYQKFNQCEVVCYPFPLNVVVGFCRYWWLKIRYFWFHPYVQTLQNQVVGLKNEVEFCEKKILQQEQEIKVLENLLKRVMDFGRATK